MRNLPPRPQISSSVQNRLLGRNRDIVAITDLRARRKKARTTYEAARQSKWFKPVVQALRSLCGDGELCMYCSSNEPSQLEHYRPLSVFPDKAFEYENYLWTCDICNRTYKGERFPPDTEPGEPILNPLDDNVWEYFFLDDVFGRLIKRVDPVSMTPLPRAVSTCDVVGIDRENVQKKRLSRMKRMRKCLQDALDGLAEGTVTVAQLRNEIATLRTEPFQADVADYFLNGPGRVNEPFRTALEAAGEAVP